MKQILHYSLLAAAAVFFISCSKEAASTNEEGIIPNDPQDETPVTPTEYDPSEYLLSFGAAFEEDKTKVEINVDSGALSFEEGDEVLVYVRATGAQSVYVYDHTQSLFVPDQGQEPVAVGNNVAYVYYPSAEFTISSETVTFTMPEAIAAGSAADLGDKVPMAGIIPDGAKEDGHPLVTFKNLGSILRARFNSSATDGEGETITAVELSVTGANITGEGTVSWDGETDAAVPSVSALEGGTTSITISVADGHLTSGAYKDFYFFLPASGELTAMTIKAVYGKTGGYEPYETVSRNSTMTLERNKIYKVQKSLSGFFSGGDGSEDYPYQIATADDFQAIATLANATQDEAFGGNRRNGYLDSSNRTFFGAAGVHYQQTADIDLNSAPLTPIGNSTRRFIGNYDGKGKKLQVNINVDSQFAAPFGYVAGNALIKDLTVTGTITSTCTASSSLAGGIAGILNDNAQITGCTNEATISSTASYTGGIAGRLYKSPESTASISYCHNKGDVVGVNDVGGIVGDLQGGKISFSENRGNITASGKEAGGIAGRIQGGTIKACYSANTTISKTNTTISGTHRVGGIAGYQSNQGSGSSLIINCAAKSRVKSSGNDDNGAAGGLVGYMYFASGKGDVVLTNSVALGNGVFNTNTTESYLGAIVGYVNGTSCYVRNCYSQHNSTSSPSAAVYYSSDNGSTVTNTKQTYMGGIYGYLKAGTIQNCYCVGTDAANGNGINTNAYGGAGKRDVTPGNTRMVSNAVKNGTATVNINSWTFAGNSIKPQEMSITNQYLVDVMNFGTWSSKTMSDRYAYTSSEGTSESVCVWEGLNGTAPTSYDPAYPKELKDLGTDYRP